MPPEQVYVLHLSPTAKLLKASMSYTCSQAVRAVRSAVRSFHRSSCRKFVFVERIVLRVGLNHSLKQQVTKSLDGRIRHLNQTPPNGIKNIQYQAQVLGTHLQNVLHVVIKEKL